MCIGYMLKGKYVVVSSFVAKQQQKSIENTNKQTNN